MSANDLEHNTQVIHHLIKMKHIFLLLSLSGLALCGSLSNEYLPPNTGVTSNAFSRSFGQFSGGSANNYSPTSQFSGSGDTFGTSFRPSAQYGAPTTPALNRQFGNQYSSIASPGQSYGAPTQYSGQYSSISQYNRPSAPSQSYGSPSQYSSFGRSNLFSSASQFRAPSSQYGAPSSVFGQQRSFGGGSYPSQYSVGSQYRSAGVSSQYGVPQQNYQGTQFGQSSFRAGPQFGGLSSAHGGVSSVYRPAASNFGTIQDSQGGYIY